MNRTVQRWVMASVVVATVVGLQAAPVAAGCKMNVFVENRGDYKLTVYRSQGRTAAKTQGGIWRSLKNGGWMTQMFPLEPGEKKGDEYAAAFSCGKKRRFRVFYMCNGGNNKDKTFTEYYPGPTSWSTTQTLTIKLTQCN